MVRMPRPYVEECPSPLCSLRQPSLGPMPEVYAAGPPYGRHWACPASSIGPNDIRDLRLVVGRFAAILFDLFGALGCHPNVPSRDVGGHIASTDDDRVCVFHGSDLLRVDLLATRTQYQIDASKRSAVAHLCAVYFASIF